MSDLMRLKRAANGIVRHFTREFSTTVNKQGGYLVIRDGQGNERKFPQRGMMAAIKRNPAKTALAGATLAGGAAYGIHRALRK